MVRIVYHQCILIKKYRLRLIERNAMLLSV